MCILRLAFAQTFIYNRIMEEFYPFFLIIFAGVFFSVVFRRIHVPWVVGLIVGGIFIGPNALDILSITPTMSFIGQIGLIFLMFMAGLETELSDVHRDQKGLFWLSFVNGVVPLIIGLAIAFLFGYGYTSALLVGIIFVSSSIAVVIPSLEQHGLLHTRLGQSVVLTSVIQDVASLVMLSLLLQNISPVTKLPLYVFYPLVISILFLLRYILPKLISFFTKTINEEKDLFQQEFRVTFVILLGTVIAFELLGLHPIIAGFFAGFILSNSIKSEILKDKIRTISYGIFIPTFFISIGAQTDVSLLFESGGTMLLVLAIVLGSVLSKFLSGWIGGRMVGFSRDQALLFGISSVPQLSTTLAVAFTALSLGYIDQKLITAMVALSIATVIVSPVLMNILGARIKDAVAREPKNPTRV
jgi:Kef-type K+ transport system membrane component KefB